jgi:hypothetical protein
MHKVVRIKCNDDIPRRVVWYDKDDHDIDDDDYGDIEKIDDDDDDDDDNCDDETEESFIHMSSTLSLYHFIEALCVPSEFRLLNGADPVIVGLGNDTCFYLISIHVYLIVMISTEMMDVMKDMMINHESL